MSFLLDIAFIAVIIIFAISASKRRGIADEIPKTASVLFASAASIKFSTFLSSFTFDTFFKEAMTKKLLPLTEKIFYMDGQSSNTERVLYALPDSIANGARWLVFNDELASAKLDSYVYHPAGLAAEEISTLVAGPVLTSLFKGVYLFLGFFVFFNIFKLIFSALKKDLKAVAYNDSVICGCLGAVRGFIYILLALGIIGLILPIFSFYGQFVSWTDNTLLFRILFNENIFIFY